MRKLNLYWRTNEEWYHFDKNMNPVVNDDAPEEAKESYRQYLEEKKARKPTSS